MLSAFTLKASQVYLSLFLAIVFEQILQGVAGMGSGSHLSSIIILLLAAWICLFAGQSRLHLVKTITRADARRERLQRYFSPGVGEILEEREEDDLALGQECELTVLFTDIRGFTELSAQLTSHDVIRLLNTYHARMVEAVFRHGGTLDKYLGDGLMAYFNAPVGQPDHAARAVRCALAMDDELTALNSDPWWPGRRRIEAGIGIHTGRAIVGDIGAPHRR
ncbi:MAG: adenylate/guanylate cyclase domain-containing protein, partial [Akkermansiaceae bacterium]|nr:adenylate/guanylate cyclase domain-containing protein [Akkermansiaceae bacterium]